MVATFAGLLEVGSDIVHSSDFGGVALHRPPLPHPKASVSHGEVGFLLLKMAVKFYCTFFSLLKVKNIVSSLCFPNCLVLVNGEEGN